MAVKAPQQFTLLTQEGKPRKRRDAAPRKRGVHRGRPKKAWSSVAHRKRPAHVERHPLHVTWRIAEGLPNMRSPEVMKAFRRAFVAGKSSFGFRLVHYSVQENHAHLVCEADDARALSRGMQGLAIRVARSVNRALGRTGKVFAERYHSRSLESPREVRNAVVYVLNNVRKHEAGRLVPRNYAGRWLDTGCTSAQHFHGWQGIAHRVPDESSEVVAPVAWLLTDGFLVHGRVRPNEVPGGIPRGAKGKRPREASGSARAQARSRRLGATTPAPQTPRSHRATTS
jgi:putative transposase